VTRYLVASLVWLLLMVALSGVLRNRRREDPGRRVHHDQRVRDDDGHRGRDGQRGRDPEREREPGDGQLQPRAGGGAVIRDVLLALLMRLARSRAWWPAWTLLAALVGAGIGAWA